MHRKKYAAPVIIAALLCAYYICFAVVIGRVPELPLWGKAIGILIPLAVCAAIIAVLISRIREIRSGEEDDLDKY